MACVFISYYITFHDEVMDMDIKDRKRMASFIKEKRNACGYTQEYVAERSGISYSYYTKIENGFQTPSLDTLLRIASLLHLSLDKMFFGDNVEENPFSPDTQELLQFISQCDAQDITHCRELLDKIISYLKI